jgi:hypothetical protein
MVVAFMAFTLGMILATFISIVGFKYHFAWPGIFKSVVAAGLMVGVFAYYAVRGRHDVLVTGDQTNVGLAHAAVIMSTVFVLTGLAMWIVFGPPYVHPPF